MKGPTRAFGFCLRYVLFVDAAAYVRRFDGWLAGFVGRMAADRAVFAAPRAFSVSGAGTEVDTAVMLFERSTAASQLLQQWWDAPCTPSTDGGGVAATDASKWPYEQAFLSQVLPRFRAHASVRPYGELNSPFGTYVAHVDDSVMLPARVAMVTFARACVVSEFLHARLVKLPTAEDVPLDVGRCEDARGCSRADVLRKPGEGKSGLDVVMGCV